MSRSHWRKVFLATYIYCYSRGTNNLHTAPSFCDYVYKSKFEKHDANTNIQRYALIPANTMGSSCVQRDRSG